MKICSLLPSSTEIVFALGLGGSLVGVTHECDYPAETAGIPSVTSSVVNGESMSGKDIHDAITGLVHGGSSIYNLDQDLLDRASPDLILTQELCDVCAVSYEQVEAAASMLQCDTRVLSLEPNTVGEILDTIRVVGGMAGVQERAEEVIGRLRSRVERVERIASQAKSKPRVLCMEWLDPVFVGGHWVPEMVAMAGGEDELGIAGKPSFQVDWQRISEYNPDLIVAMPCGFSAGRTMMEMEKTVFPDEWHGLDAVKKGEVYVVDGSSYFNRPGPRVVDGLEILAQIFHPELFSPEGAKFGGMVKVPYPVRGVSG